MPKAVMATGDRFLLRDNTETPDTMLATFHYPRFIGSYENRGFNPLPMFHKGAGTSIHGTKGTVIVNRSGCWLIPVEGSSLAEASYENDDEMKQMNVPHWRNFLDCIKSRQKPTSDIETCVRSSTVCLLANLSMRLRIRLDWDENNWTVLQDSARSHLKARYRKPWKLDV